MIIRSVLGETWGQFIESLWLSTPGLVLKISSSPNSSRCCVDTKPPCQRANTGPLRANQWLCLCVIVVDVLNQHLYKILYFSLFLSISSRLKCSLRTRACQFTAGITFAKRSCSQFRDDMWSARLISNHCSIYKTRLSLQISCYPNSSRYWVGIHPILTIRKFLHKAECASAKSHSTCSKQHPPVKSRDNGARPLISQNNHNGILCFSGKFLHYVLSLKGKFPKRYLFSPLLTDSVMPLKILTDFCDAQGPLPMEYSKYWNKRKVILLVILYPFRY